METIIGLYVLCKYCRSLVSQKHQICVERITPKCHVSIVFSILFSTAWDLTDALLTTSSGCSLFSHNGLMAPNWRIPSAVCLDAPNSYICIQQRMDTCINSHFLSLSPLSFFFLDILCNIWMKTGRVTAPFWLYKNKGGSASWTIMELKLRCSWCTGRHNTGP